MSFVGCNFICKNEECECHNTSFTLTGAWPLGEIDEILKSSNDDQLKKDLEKRRSFGYKYAKKHLT